jgi:hypothetical protein
MAIAMKENYFAGIQIFGNDQAGDRTEFLFSNKKTSSTLSLDRRRSNRILEHATTVDYRRWFSYSLLWQP